MQNLATKILIGLLSMQDLAIKILIGLLTKLLSETFIAKLVIASLEAWAKTTENKLDDKVVAAMAEALGVPVEKMPKSDAA